MVGPMSGFEPKIRLYVDQPLAEGQSVDLTREQAHYLFGVMRQGEGADVALFNGRDGEWVARVAEAGKRGGRLECLRQARPLILPPDLWLLFAPIKKARTDFIVEKAVELGVSRIQPVQTDFTNSERIRQDRLQAHAVEAAEQCGATAVPQVADLERLDRLLARWPQGRRLMFCDEGRAGQGPALATLTGETAGPWAILIGPEGGFSEPERGRLASLPFAVAAPLGPRILRADTAAVAAITLWQATLGDWR
jgi:16S rRNA (uracil1498-N3)-methyltransferase